MWGAEAAFWGSKRENLDFLANSRDSRRWCSKSGISVKKTDILVFSVLVKKSKIRFEEVLVWTLKYSERDFQLISSIGQFPLFFSKSGLPQKLTHFLVKNHENLPKNGKHRDF